MTTVTVPPDSKRYELMAIVKPDIGEDGIKKRLDSMRQQITSAKGEIFHEELWGLRDLSYPIKKQEKGYYAVFDFFVEPEKIKEFDRTLRLDNEVLRHLITILPATYEPKDYVAEAAAEAQKVTKEKQETEAKKTVVPLKKEASTAAGAEKAKVTAEKPVEETTQESPKKPTKKEQTLEDVDAKLKSIIDNPDLNF